MEVFHYYVEGETEEKIIRILKTNFRSIVPGKIQVLDVTKKLITKMHLMQLKPNTNVVLVFDTDTDNLDILKKNIKLLEKTTYIKNVYLIPQSKNLEDELISSCDVKQIKELLKSRSNKDFKRDVLAINDTGLCKALIAHNFDIKKMWCKQPSGKYIELRNDSKIVIKRGV